MNQRGKEDRKEQFYNQFYNQFYKAAVPRVFWVYANGCNGLGRQSRMQAHFK